MYRKMNEILGHLDYDELLRMNKDIDSGSLILKKLVKEKIDETKRQHETHCSICQSPIQPESTSNYTILFGPDSFKKKATFCALDCMEYFLSGLKAIKSTPAREAIDALKEQQRNPQLSRE